MTEAESDDLDGILDRFEARLRRRWAIRSARIQREHRKRLKASEGCSLTLEYTRTTRPSLDHYDGTQEFHGQD